MLPLSTLSSFSFSFNECIERIFKLFLYPETANEYGYQYETFKLSTIQNYPNKIYHVTLNAYKDDIIEIQNVHMIQDSNYSTLTNLVTKVNNEILKHPIWMEIKFFFNSCTNNTYLIIENKIEDSNIIITEVLQELISNSIFLKECQKIKEFLLQLNKNILHTESVLILRPLTQIWKCIEAFDFWKSIYSENKYTFTRDLYDGENEEFILINTNTNIETSYKVKKKTLLKDRISLRILKRSNSKNSIKKYICLSILSISQITCFMILETEIFSSVNLDFINMLSHFQKRFLRNLKSNMEKLPCES